MTLGLISPKGPPPRKSGHIFLTGFMGSGKTTVGKILAGQLGRPFIDLDARLEAAYGKSVAEVFRDPLLGEADFRRREAEAIRGLLSMGSQPKVVALGGGAAEDPKSRAALQESGARVFCLTTDDPELLWERVRAGSGGSGPSETRPLARDFKAFKALFQKRRKAYRALGTPVDASLPPRRAAEAIGARLTAREKTLRAPCEFSSTLKTFLSKREAAEALAEKVSGRRCLLLLDHALAEEELMFAEALGKGAVICQTSARGEEAKTLSELTDILQTLSDNSFDRSDFLAARGGGSLTDLGAMAAGLFKRGIRLILMPSTLLAAADAAIGGKAAVNFNSAKNQIGLFYLPSDVWMDGETLASLSPSLIAEGLTEAYKMGLIMDQGLLGLITENISHLTSPPPLRLSPETGLAESAERAFSHGGGPFGGGGSFGDGGPFGVGEGRAQPRADAVMLLDIAFRAAELKMEVVASDLREERGLRDKLNFGHTFGHAAESFYAGAQSPISHGRAVAWGMAAALLYSERRLGLDPAFASASRSVCLTLAGGEFPELPDEEALKRLFKADKKIREGRLKFIALPKPCRAELIEASPDDIIGAARGLEAERKSGKLRPSA